MHVLPFLRFHLTDNPILICASTSQSSLLRHYWKRICSETKEDCIVNNQFMFSPFLVLRFHANLILSVPEPNGVYLLVVLSVMDCGRQTAIHEDNQMYSVNAE